MPVATEDVRIEDDVLGGSRCAGPQPVGACRSRPCASIGLALLVERHHDRGAALQRNLRGRVFDLPAFQLVIELTTPCLCRQRRPWFLMTPTL